MRAVQVSKDVWATWWVGALSHDYDGCALSLCSISCHVMGSNFESKGSESPEESLACAGAGHNGQRVD
ncbi:hypothetical protein PI125_g11825 [Phytophthora idaei]|nr:hypothetical protein PI125_g11825 [Phytophthora idaei]KAG3144535.1 hypothetical protein PI126_g14129 [Phytophthora idaei]